MEATGCAEISPSARLRYETAKVSGGRWYRRFVRINVAFFLVRNVIPCPVERGGGRETVSALNPGISSKSHLEQILGTKLLLPYRFRTC